MSVAPNTHPCPVLHEVKVRLFWKVVRLMFKAFCGYDGPSCKNVLYYVQMNLLYAVVKERMTVQWLSLEPKSQFSKLLGHLFM